jgi:septum formation protein
MNVILASASPRRKELLKNIFDKFQVIPADIDEDVSGISDVVKAPEYIATEKARAVAKDNPDSLVIGCDTGVIVDNIILGKPADKEDCKRMLRLLSGRKHMVVTGCCLCYKGREHSFSAITLVEFYNLSDEDIENYLKIPEIGGNVKYQWQDKAGGYGIQSGAMLFVKGIEGDYNNVVGLPCAKLNQEINKNGKLKIENGKLWSSRKSTSKNRLLCPTG